jgi:aminoglycoside phosphotransferase (APT) family kinase protein
MDRVIGDSSTQGLLADPELKREIATQFVEILAALHTLGWEKLGLHFLGVPKRGEDCAIREVEKWEHIYRSQMLEPQPLLEEELLWLKNNAPKQVERVSLLWGDPGPGNFLYKDGRITGVVDWELAHLGDPMDDLGFLIWRTGITEGLMDRQELLEYYERVSGIKVNEDSIKYYQILANVKTAIMTHTATRGFCDSKNLNPNLAAIGLLIFRISLKQAAELMGL